MSEANNQFGCRMVDLWSATAFKISAIYFLAGGLYVVATEWLLEGGEYNDWFFGIEMVQGVAIVFFTAILIYVLIAQELRRRLAIELKMIQAQRMEAVGKLASGVAHDFNNFLTVIIGNLELIQQEACSSSDHRHQMDTALLAAERSADLARRLLAFSSERSLEAQYFNLNECLIQVKLLLDSVLGEGIKVNLDLAPELPSILADPGQLETCLLNLGLNARDAMPSGGDIIIRSSTESLNSEIKLGNWRVAKGNYVVITVEDEGHGMSQQTQDRLLEPFFTTKPVGKGTGLGFPMTYTFVRQTGGNVVVQSNLDHGTSVALYFPIATDIKASRYGFDRVSEVRKGDELILVVDNDEAVRRVLSELLKSLGYCILTASDVKEARKLINENNEIDLFITDIDLAGSENGVELATDICCSRPFLPVLFISGVADPAIIREFSNSARLGWLDKPFNRVQISQEIRDLLDG